MIALRASFLARRGRGSAALCLVMIHLLALGASGQGGQLESRLGILLGEVGSDWESVRDEVLDLSPVERSATILAIRGSGAPGSEFLARAIEVRRDEPEFSAEFDQKLKAIPPSQYWDRLGRPQYHAFMRDTVSDPRAHALCVEVLLKRPELPQEIRASMIGGLRAETETIQILSRAFELTPEISSYSTNSLIAACYERTRDAAALALLESEFRVALKSGRYVGHAENIVIQFSHSCCAGREALVYAERMRESFRTEIQETGLRPWEDEEFSELVRQVIQIEKRIELLNEVMRRTERDESVIAELAAATEALVDTESRRDARRIWEALERTIGKLEADSDD